MPLVPQSPPPLRVREATEGDREWAATLMAASEPWRTLGRDLAQCRRFLAAAPDATLYVATASNAPAAFVLYRPRGMAGAPYIASIATDAAWRGRGVGSWLLDHVATVLAPPARHLFLCVSSFNHDAQRLYLRHGYRHVGDLPAYLTPAHSELILLKRLAP